MNVETMWRRRPISMMIAGLVATIAFLAVTPSSASAHATLVASDPSPSAILESSPAAIRLEFSEPVSPPADAIELFDASGALVRGGSIAAGVSPTSVEMTDVPSLSDGIHVVAWRVVSSDGHLVRGAYTFTVGAVDTSGVDVGELIGGVLAGRAGSSGVETVLVIVRWLAYLALVVALGALSLVVLPSVDRRRLGTTVLASSSALTVASLAHFALQGVYITSSDWSGLFDADAWSRVLDTRLGSGIMIRLGLIAVFAALTLVATSDGERAQHRVGTSWWQSTTALVAAGILVTFSVGGHPSAVSLAGLAVVVDSVHLGAIALWIGGLITVVVLRWRDVEIVTRLSRIATYAAPVAVLTGVWQTWRIGGGFGSLTDTTWGRGMIVKIALVVVTLALGGVARLVVRRSADEAPHRLRRLMPTEVLIATAVLATSAYVVGEPPVVTRPPAVYSVTLAQSSLIVDLTVTPGFVGNNEIHVVVSPPGGALQRVTSLEMRATPPGDGRVPLTVAVVGAGPNHYVGRVAFTEPGDWLLEILVKPDPSSTVRLSDVVPVERL